MIINKFISLLYTIILSNLAEIQYEGFEHNTVELCGFVAGKAVLVSRA
jgi:hypothetical protein